MQALQAHTQTLKPDEKKRAMALRRVWNRSRPIEYLNVTILPRTCGPGTKDISQIAKHVYPSIQRLARGRAPLTNREDCAKRRPFAHQRMLAAFGQCTGTPNFVFDLSGAQDATARAIKATEWMCLYSSAIWCSMGTCTKGFVFIDWMLSPDRPQTMLLWFDAESGKQLLIDPSGTADVFHNMFSKKQHPASPIQHAKVFDVNDMIKLKQCLQQEPAQFHCDDVTLLVLIAWTCLRFGYKDVEQVIRAILCALCQHMQQQPLHFRKFWELLVVWRNELRLEALTDNDDLLYLLGLKVVNNNEPCGYQMDNGTACPKSGHRDNVWCSDHMRTKTQTNENLLKVPMFPLPDNVARVACQPVHLQATAYFEDRWQETNWKCSWDMFQWQKEQIDENYEWCNRIGCVRFVSVVDIGESWIKEILRKFVEHKELQSSTNAFGVLNVDFLTGNHRHHEVEMVLQQVPVHPWSAMVVATRSIPVFVSLHLATYSSVSAFQTTINGFLTSPSPVSFYLRIGTEVRTTQGLVCKRPLFTVCCGLRRC